MGIDSWFPHAHSKTQTEDYQLTCSQYCLNTSSILEKKFKTCHSPFRLRHLNNFQDLVLCPPVFHWVENARWRNAHLLTLSFTKLIPWSCEGDGFTSASSLWSPCDPHLLEQLWTAWLGPPTHLGIFRTKHRTKMNFSNRKGMQSA